MSSQRRFSGPQYMGAAGLSRNRPASSGLPQKKFFKDIKPQNYGYKTLSEDTARQIAEALRSMLHLSLIHI